MAPMTKLACVVNLFCASFDPTWAEVLAWRLSPLWIAIQLHPHWLCGQVPIRASHRAYACVVGLSVPASTRCSCLFQPNSKWEKTLLHLVLRDYARAPVPSKATYGCLSPSWPVGSTWIASFCVTVHVFLYPSRATLWSPVTSVAGGAGWRGLVCLGQHSVSNRVWRQGLWANAPCWAHAVASDGICAKAVSVSTKQCAMCSGFVEWEVMCAFVFVYSSAVCGWLLAKVQHGLLQSWLRQW